MPVLVTPWVFGAAVAASLGVVALHLLSVRMPPELVLPTARFVPPGDARAVARQPRLNDVPLLLLRVLALLLVGAALAGVRWQDTRVSRLRLVVTDAQWAGDSVWRDSVVSALTAADAVVDVHFARGVAADPGAAIVAATQRAAALVTSRPSLARVELTVVTEPVVRTRLGFQAWRAQWPGAMQVQVRKAAASRVMLDSTGSPPPTLEVVGGDGDDVVAAAMTGVELSAAALVRIDRSARGTRAATAEGIRVSWPRDGVPSGWEERAVPDTVGALAANDAVLVAPFVRTAVPGAALQAQLSAPSDSAAAAAAPVRVIAWWSDGLPAALEFAATSGAGAQCSRVVAVRVPDGSDLLLSDGARGLLRALVAPCGDSRVPAPASRTAGDVTGTVTGDAPATAFRTESAMVNVSDPWWLTPVLLGLGVLLLLAEWLWRDRADNT